MAPAWTSFAWFALVLALIPAGLWLLKRSGWQPGGGLALPGRRSGLKLVESLAIGPQQRLVTVEIGDGAQRHRLVLGVTAQSITTLRELTPLPAEQAVPAPDATRTGWLAQWTAAATSLPGVLPARAEVGER